MTEGGENPVNQTVDNNSTSDRSSVTLSTADNNIISTSSQSLPVISTTSNPVNTLASTQDVTVGVEEMNNNNNNNNVSSHRTQSLFPSLRFPRDMMERANPRRSLTWRQNINHVFQEIRPLVQSSNHSTSGSILASFIPQNRNYRMSTSVNESQGSPDVRASNDSIVINMNMDQPSPSTSNLPRDAILNTTNTSTRSFIPYDRSISLQQTHFLPQSQSQSHISMFETNERSQSLHGAINSSNPGSVDNLPSGNNNGNGTNNANSHGSSNGDGEADSLAQMPEARKFIDTLCRYFPYIAILFVKSCYDHLDGILDIFALFVTFAHSNFVLRQEILKQSSRRILTLIRELMYIILVIVIIGFMLEKNNSLINLMIKPFDQEEEFTLKKLLFSVCITDLMLKLFTVGIKILFTLLPAAVIEYKNRGRVYLMMEAISQLGRALAPIQSWLFFLLDSYKGTEKIMGVILAAAYMVAKGNDLLQRAKFCKRSFVKLLQKTSFGVTPTKEQIQQAGVCSICHDNYNSPVMLECNHIFCELCVGTWFDRERSCPLCRAVVVDSPEYRDGSTTFFIQFY